MSEASDAQFDVVGIGSAIVDILAHADDVFVAKHTPHKGTMLWVEESQSNAIYDSIRSSREVSGGSAANTMAGIASLGGRAAFIGKTKSDRIGKIFSQDIRAAGVHFDTNQLSSGLATARCIILVTPDAQRTMFTYLGASGFLSSEDMDNDLIAASRIIYIEGYQWDLPKTKSAILGACVAAKSACREVSLTLSDPFVVERHRDDLLGLINNHVDVLFGNEQEIISLFQVNSYREAREAIAGRCKVAVLTRGAEGAMIVTPSSVIEIPAHRANRVVDTTGAGDLFAAGFLYGYVRGDGLKSCGHLGALAAGTIISHLGARPVTPLKDLVARSLKS